ncbi:MAG: hypothetical protein H5U40_12445, partial [Polyangiaceae bacterium]|nr:hypothetical protein [Polyangiaceae bacterium]
MTTHPFSRFDASARRVLWLVLTPVVLGCVAALGAIDHRLRTADVPYGIVQYELAGDAVAVSRILQSWGTPPDRNLYAAFSLGF